MSAALGDELARGFRAAMRKLAATACLVTTAEAGARHGMPATSVSSLSMAPPSLLVSINRSASMHGPTLRSRFFCVNLLSDAQGTLLRDFGGRASAERFDVGVWRAGPEGLPYLADAAASLFCAVDAEMHYGTHTVFAGRVLGTQVSEDALPLVWQGGLSGHFVPD